jgi:uncharacterized protein (DUF4415 family)
MNKSKSKTDWSRVRREAAANSPIVHAPADGPYDPNADAAVDRYWASTVIRRPGQRGKQKAPTKQLVTLRLSAEVLQHFRSTGRGWQTRLDESLKAALPK